MHRRRAKIAATLGPTLDRRGKARALIDAGADIARLNFSHGTSEDHGRRVEAIRRAARAARKPVTLLADLQGPRFRVGELEGGSLDLVEGEAIDLVAGSRRADAGQIPVGYAALADDVCKGARILLDDGKLELRVVGKRGKRVRCEVIRGGELSDHKGINLPGTDLSVPALMPKDRRDLKTAVALGADWLAVSFVRRAKDVVMARRALRRAGSSIPVMSKIERPEAIDDLDAIIAESDGLLVARGDLGVEMAPERVPVLQKQIIEATIAAGKPVMTATQMLDSMRNAPRPTRAEASDVANAVLDGSSSLLLTGETAAGSYPIESVEMMARIIEQAETSTRTFRATPPEGELTVPVATSLAACRAAYDVRARFLVVFTQTGFSATQVARFRPSTPILAFTPDAGAARRLNVHWGIDPREFKLQKSVDRMLSALDRALLREGLVERGDAVVILMGTPIGVGGTTNLMELRRVGVSPTRRLVIDA